MIQILCLFFPAAISVYIIQNFQKRKTDLVRFIYRYCFYTLAINIIMVFILRVKYPTLIFNEQVFTINFIFKYLIAAVILSIILPIIYEFLRKNVQVEFIILKNNKEERNTNEN